MVSLHENPTSYVSAWKQDSHKNHLSFCAYSLSICVELALINYSKNGAMCCPVTFALEHITHHMLKCRYEA